MTVKTGEWGKDRWLVHDS